MAPVNLPNGLTLYDVGYAALNSPPVAPPPLSVPLTNIIGALQYQPPALQNHSIAQLASQFLKTLLEYQTTSTEPTLHDPTEAQYYFSAPICLLNILNTSPDVCKRIAAHPTLLHTVIDKFLQPDFETKMKAAMRRQTGPFPPATFEDDFGSLLQFLSTILLYRDEMTSLHPQIKDLIPKLRVWKREYKNSRVRTISNAADRLVGQIEGMDQTLIDMMRGMQAESLVCGVSSCGVKGATGLTVCAKCGVQRYCGREHQKADWKYHKYICDKGLVKPDDE